MNDRFAEVATRAEMNERFAEVRAEMDARFEQIRGEIVRSHEETRRHFDIVYERSKDDVKRIVEGHVTLAAAQDALGEEHDALARKHEKLADRVARIERRLLGPA